MLLLITPREFFDGDLAVDAAAVAVVSKTLKYVTKSQKSEIIHGPHCAKPFKCLRNAIMSTHSSFFSRNKAKRLISAEKWAVNTH